jgi:hypothetical protein
LLYPLSYGGARRSVKGWSAPHPGAAAATLVPRRRRWSLGGLGGRWPPEPSARGGHRAPPAESSAVLWAARAANPNRVATAPIVALSDYGRRRRRWRSRSPAGNGISGQYAEYRSAAHVHDDHGVATAGCGPGKAAGGVRTLIDDQARSRHRARGRRCGRAGDRGLWKQLGHLSPSDRAHLHQLATAVHGASGDRKDLRADVLRGGVPTAGRTTADQCGEPQRHRDHHSRPAPERGQPPMPAVAHLGTAVGCGATRGAHVRLRVTCAAAPTGSSAQ